MSLGDGIPIKGLGTAGAADPDIVTVQGIAGGTGVPVTFATPITVQGFLGMVPILNIPPNQAVGSTYLTAFPAANLAATVVFPATPGKQWVLHQLLVGLMTLGAAVSPNTFAQVLNGAALIWGTNLGVPAVAGTSQIISQTGLVLIGNINTAMTVTLAAAGLNTFIFLSASAYLQ